MAETRSNLVPRMAISTILNEHINEALVDFRPIAQPARSPAGAGRGARCPCEWASWAPLTAARQTINMFQFYMQYLKIPLL